MPAYRSLTLHPLYGIRHIDGILIPGANASTTVTTHVIQQQVVDAYGAAITKAVQDLAPRTDLSGPQTGSDRHCHCQRGHAGFCRKGL